MEPIVLKDIPFQIDRVRMIQDLCPGGDPDTLESLERLAGGAERAGRPKGLFRAAFVEERGEGSVVVEGVTLESRVLRVNLEEVHRVFPYAVTGGTEIDEWARALPDPFERFWADYLMEQVLYQAAERVQLQVEDMFETGPLSSMNPGSLPDWPMPEQVPLFALLGDPETAIGVSLSDSCLMQPVKSISGIFFTNQVDFYSCRLCPRDRCSNRRAPYDQALWEERYGKVRS